MYQEKSNYYYNEITHAIYNNQTEKAEYLIYHLLENEDDFPILIYIKYLSNSIKDHSILRKILYKQIMKHKKDIYKRISLIHILYKNKEYEKSIKWCEKSLKLANNQQKLTIYFYLSKIFYYLNRPERSIRYINLCLQFNQRYKPALRLKQLILKDLYYESY